MSHPNNFLGGKRPPVAVETSQGSVKVAFDLGTPRAAPLNLCRLTITVSQSHVDEISAIRHLLRAGRALGRCIQHLFDFSQGTADTTHILSKNVDNMHKKYLLPVQLSLEAAGLVIMAITGAWLLPGMPVVLLIKLLHNNPAPLTWLQVRTAETILIRNMVVDNCRLAC